MCDIVCLQEVSRAWAQSWKEGLVGGTFALTHEDKKAILHRSSSVALIKSFVQQVFPESKPGAARSLRKVSWAAQ